MAKINIPRDVLEALRNAVYAKADTVNYPNQGRNKNGAFINDLVDDQSIGAVLKNYMPQQRIRTYIKDSVLNRYSKAKINKLLSIDIEKKLSLAENLPVFLIERKIYKSSTVCLYRTEKDEFIVIGEGTVLKWETALRRALEFIDVCPGKGIDGRRWKIYVCLASTDKSLTQSDKDHIISSLQYINVNAIFLENNI